MEKQLHNALKEHSEALQACLLAKSVKTNADVVERKAHYRLLRAEDELRACKREILDFCQ